MFYTQSVFTRINAPVNDVDDDDEIDLFDPKETYL